MGPGLAGSRCTNPEPGRRARVECGIVGGGDPSSGEALHASRRALVLPGRAPLRRAPDGVLADGCRGGEGRRPAGRDGRRGRGCVLRAPRGSPAVDAALARRRPPAGRSGEGGDAWGERAGARAGRRGRSRPRPRRSRLVRAPGSRPPARGRRGAVGARRCTGRPGDARRRDAQRDRPRVVLGARREGPPARRGTSLAHGLPCTASARSGWAPSSPRSTAATCRSRSATTR